MIKKIIFTIAIICATLYGAQAWVKSLLPEKAHFEQLKQTKRQDISYLTDNLVDNRGKILAVVTSVNVMGEGKKTGYELTELARAYWVFVANGFDVDIASPKGGKPPVVIDGEDMGAYDYAFLNDQAIQQKLSQTLMIADVNPEAYEAVYFVGGKGTMFDFPNDTNIQWIAKTLYQNNKVVSAVCHGPAALVNVQLDNGEMLIADKRISGFTNEEELFLIPNAEEIFPFLLQDKLTAQGAQFQPGIKYLEKVVHDGKLITGQNPWSVWTLAEKVIKEIGYTPKPRVKTPEEFSIELLLAYEKQGVDVAKSLLQNNPEKYQRILILMHSVLAFMQWEIGKGIDLLLIANELKSLSSM